jgi:lipid-binding SYLF domain-containing protein
MKIQSPIQENKMTASHRTAVAAVAATAVLALAAGAACGQASPQPASGQRDDTSTRADKQEATASRHVTEAIAVVRAMDAEPRMRALLQQCKGVFIVPTYGRAALGVGASGGAGVLVVRRSGGDWSNPAFYNMGGLSVGLQAGAQGGSLALLLMNDKAVGEFVKKNNFSLNAKAGLTVVNWSTMAQGSAGTGDVVAWSGTKGLFGDLATIEVNDVRFNQSLTNAYYHRTLPVSDVIAGAAVNAQAGPLIQALANSAGATR